jgi:hypothetical protein
MSKTVQITVKVGQRVVTRAANLRPFLSEEQGREATRADVYRHALSLGLAQMARRQRERSGVPESGAGDEDDRELVDEATTATG